jgi:hypothetical protein
LPLQVVDWLGTASGRGWLVDEQHGCGRDLEGQVPLFEAERRHEEDRLPILMTRKVVRAARGMGKRGAHGGHGDSR